MTSGCSGSTASGGSTGLDDGLLLPLSEVGETYRQLSLYFLGPSGHTLVPDTVLLPERAGSDAPSWSPGCCAGRPRRCAVR